MQSAIHTNTGILPKHSMMHHPQLNPTVNANTSGAPGNVHFPKQKEVQWQRRCFYIAAAFLLHSIFGKYEVGDRKSRRVPKPPLSEVCKSITKWVKLAFTYRPWTQSSQA